MEVYMRRYTWVALCIVAAGVSLAKSERNTNPTKYDLIMDITNHIYSDSLRNNGSADYKILSSQVNGALYSIYGCSTCQTHKIYQGVSAMTFSNQDGTVLVKSTLTFQTDQISTGAIKEMFLSAIEGTNRINDLTINPELTQVLPGSTPSTSTTTTATTRPTITTNRPSSTTTTNPLTRSTTALTIQPTSTTTARPSTHPTTTTSTTHPTTTTSTTHPTTTTSTTHPTTHTTTVTTTHPTPLTTKTSEHHNAASSLFHQSPLISFLCYSVSFIIFFLTSYSF